MIHFNPTPRIKLRFIFFLLAKVTGVDLTFYSSPN